MDGERVSIYGIVDLVHLQSDRIEIIDYKTDRGRLAEEEYQKQLSVYYHVLSRVYPDQEVTAKIFYTEEGETVTIDPVSEAVLVSLMRERL